MQYSTKQLYDQKVGHWEIKSGGEIEGDVEMNTVKFKVKEGAQAVTLQFVFDDSKKETIKRELKVKK